MDCEQDILMFGNFPDINFGWTKLSLRHLLRFV